MITLVSEYFMEFKIIASVTLAMNIYTTPCANIASATLMKEDIFAPFP